MLCTPLPAHQPSFLLHQSFTTPSVLSSRSPEPDSPSELSYHHVPRGPASTMYHHHVHPSSLLFPDSRSPVQHPAYHLARRSPPASILTDNLVASADDSDAAPYSASPMSSPSELIQSQHAQRPPFSFPPPMSAPHSQPMFPRFAHNAPGADPSAPNSSSSRFPFSNPTLDRRMSEPVLGGARASYPQPAAHGHSQADFAYSSSAASSASTVHVNHPPLSPRPSSSQYSSYSSYSNPGGHHRAGSGASDNYSSAQGQGWQLKSDLDLEGGDGAGTAVIAVGPGISGSPVSPFYAGSAASGSDASAPGLSSPRSPQRPGQQPPNHARADPSRNASGRNSKTYSFVSLPGNAVKKRPRRRYDEIERLYRCSWPNCNKAYGTLNHLNAHVTMQKHGSKRSPGEFKELRKQWRQAKKEADEEREREREAAHQHTQHMIPHPSHGYTREFEHHHTLTSRHTRRRSLDPYPDPHGLSYGSLPSPISATFPPSSYGLAGPGMERYSLTSSTDELQYPQQQQQHMHQAEEDVGLYRSHHHHHSQHMQGALHGDSLAGWPQSDLRHGHAALNVPPRGALHPYYSAPAQQAPSLPPAHTFLPPPGSPAMLHHPPLPPGHAQGQFSGHQEQELPQLAAHVSLGHNRLPPDSTLLTALPGFSHGDDGLGRGYD